MAIPDFQSIMLPLLRRLEDGTEKTFRSLIEELAKEFGLSVEEREQMLPSGYDELFDNRVGWAKFHLKKAGLLRDARRGVMVITDRGREVLRDPPVKITLAYLDRYDDFREFRRANKMRSDLGVAEVSSDPIDPKEILESAHEALHKALAEELLERIRSVTPGQFENLVVKLLVGMGYGGSILDAGRAVGRSGDAGIDGEIKEDKLGLDKIYLQAKRWDNHNPVGSGDLRDFVGALVAKKAKKGVFITTSSFTKDAQDYVHQIDQRLVLIDGVKLADLMIEHDIGVSTAQRYYVKKIDEDFFDGI